MLSGRDLSDELITRPEESYRLWCVVVYDLETTKIHVNEEEGAKAHYGAIAPIEKKFLSILCLHKACGSWKQFAVIAVNNAIMKKSTATYTSGSTAVLSFAHVSTNMVCSIKVFARTRL